MLATLGMMAALVVALLVVPVRIDVDVDTARTSGPISVRVRWLFVSWRTGRPEPRRPAVRTAGPPGVLRSRRSRRWAGGPSSFRAAVRTPGFLATCLRLARALLGVLRPRHLWLRVRAGLDDPAATGELLGAVCAVTGWADPCRCQVWFEPDFEGASLSATGRGSWSLRPGWLLWLVVTFAAAPAVWRAAWAARRASRSVTRRRPMTFDPGSSRRKRPSSSSGDRDAEHD